MRSTSDSYFEKCTENFDLVFIDGLHECQQVNRDISNALRVLKPGGAIVLHDCNPQREDEATFPPDPRRPGGEWNGDVWRSILLWRSYSHVDTAVGAFDWGCGVVLPRANSDPLTLSHSYSHYPWTMFDSRRKELLRTMTFAELKVWVEK